MSKPNAVWVVEAKYRSQPQDTYDPLESHYSSREMARDEAKRHARMWPGTFRYRVSKYVRQP